MYPGTSRRINLLPPSRRIVLSDNPANRRGATAIKPMDTICKLNVRKVPLMPSLYVSWARYSQSNTFLDQSEHQTAAKERFSD